MTIAIGIIASNGLVIAADTQETLHGVWKYGHGKVSAMVAAIPHSILGTRSSCLVTGAGDGHHIDAISRKLREAFAKHQQVPSPHISVKDMFAGILKSFYADHVIPFAGYPPDERPDFELLIGCEAPSTTLFQSQGNVFTVESPVAAVGIGAMVALPLLARFYKPIPDVKSAVLLALYVMFHVKESIEGCGKDTDIYGIHNGKFFMVRRRDAEELERAMSAFSSDVEPFFFRGLTGINSDEQRKASKKAQAQLKNLIAKLSLR